MNGTTTIDSINPCRAEMDRHTYGCRSFNFTVWGKRLLRIGVLGVYLDLYWTKWHLMYARVRNGGVLFFPGGSLTWPMPIMGSNRTATKGMA